MSGGLPVTIDPDRIAQVGGRLRGRIVLRDLQRLASALDDANGDVEVELEGGLDDQNIRFLRGLLRATVGLICQRCLQPMAYPLEVDVQLGVSHSIEEANRLPAAYEPLVVGAGPVALAGIVEDELLLALPIVARHETAACHAAPARRERDRSAERAEGRRRPFAGLAKMLDGGKG